MTFDLTPTEVVEWRSGTRVVHGGGKSHLRTEPCLVCERLTRRVAGQTLGGYVLLEAVAVHAYECPAWRTGKRRGPCRCEAKSLWAQHFSEMVDVVMATR